MTGPHGQLVPLAGSLARTRLADLLSAKEYTLEYRLMERLVSQGAHDLVASCLEGIRQRLDPAILATAASGSPCTR